jgi:thiamine-phosphate pyrophosphorylase
MLGATATTTTAAATTAAATAAGEGARSTQVVVGSELMAHRCLLYYITDRKQFPGDEDARRAALLGKIAEAALAGVNCIQLREKDLSTRELEKLAREVVSLIRQNSPATCLLINSRTDVALATGADGVHLRADDVTPADARRIVEGAAHRRLITTRFLVAASCHTVADVLRAESEQADFAVFGPVFGKSGAPKTEPTGLVALSNACKARIPVFALGGITTENAASCLKAGAVGVAGIRLFQENKIEDVVRAAAFAK